MGLFVGLSEFVISLVGSFGHYGVIFLMLLESTPFPMPSELVMPFAGFLVANGTFSLLAVMGASTLGTIAGSALSYSVGFYGGSHALRKMEKHVIVDEHSLQRTQEWFRKYGSLAVFLCRFMPGARHMSSMVAGMAKMDLGKFIFFTTLGGSMWNFILIYAGMKLEGNWALVKHYSEPIDAAVAAILIILVFAFVAHRITKHVRNRKMKNG